MIEGKRKVMVVKGRLRKLEERGSDGSEEGERCDGESD